MMAPLINEVLDQAAGPSVWYMVTNGTHTCQVFDDRASGYELETPLSLVQGMVKRRSTMSSNASKNREMVLKVIAMAAEATPTIYNPCW